MQSRTQASSGLNAVATAPTELQLETRTEAQPGQSEPDAQLREEMDPKLPVRPHITPQPLLQCLECHIIFSDPERQQRHLKRSHPSEYEQYILRNAFFACYICGLQFTNSEELKAHQKTHTEKKAYKCMICGQAFNRSFQLTLHKKIHIGQGGYKCTDCGKACKTMTLLKYHRRTHTGERPFICKECGRRFAMSKYLKKHMLFHSKRSAEGDERHISEDGGFKGTNTLLNFVKANHALLPAEPGTAPPAGHQMKQSTPVVTESVSQPALPQLGACGSLPNVNTNMDTELSRWHSENLGNMQKVNHVVILRQVPVGEHEVASGDGGPKTVSCSVCNTIFKTTNTLLSHIRTRHASLLSAANKASEAGHLVNLPIIQNALWRLMANGPIYKCDTNMDEEQIFILTEFLKSIQRVNSAQQVSQGTEVTDGTTEKTAPSSIYQEGGVTTDVKEVVIGKEIKVEEEYNGDKPLSVILHRVLDSTPNSIANQELCLKTVINKSQLVSDPPLAGSPCQDRRSASMQTQHHSDVQVKEKCSVGLHEAQATQGNVKPANVFDTSSPSKQGSLTCTDCGLVFTNQEVFRTHLHQHALEEEEEEEEAEEEEAEKRENWSHAEQLDFTGMNVDESRDQDIDGDENLSTTSSSLQSNPSGVTQDGAVRNLIKNHFCLVCGKVYKYPSALMRHQRQHIKPDPVVKCVQKAAKYECQDCGMAFIRKARLIAHMRTHRSSGPASLESLNCDQCNKSFTSDKLWQNHIELHKRKPFWCLRCSVGFSSEQSLEKHLLGHNVKNYTCDICSKSFRLHSQLMRHQNTHTGARPFQCTLCGQAFANPRNLILHKKLHVRVSSGVPFGLKESVGGAKKLGIKNQKQTFTSVSEVTDMNVSELTDEGYWMEESRTLKGYEDIELEDSEYTVETDSWEPVHPCNTSKPPGFTVSDVHHESTSETMQQTEQQLDEKETRDTIVYEDHKHWEWECCVCEMGFDEVAELHMHYIKHATGELPIKHDELRS